MAGLLSNDLINDLSRVPSLRIIARSTSLQYAKPPVDVAALGKELGVQYVVEGDVRLDDQKVRVNVALIDTKTRLHVWTERYERDDTDRVQVQDEIVRAIARQLLVGVMEVRGRGPANATIDSMLGKGWAALNQFAFFRGGHESGQHFQDVLALDPKNVSALTGLGAFKAVAYNTRQTSERFAAEASTGFDSTSAMGHFRPGQAEQRVPPCWLCPESGSKIGYRHLPRRS
jgi:adenylate cyclase